jgi:L-threonylcarbamoyladenylate synthase|tara:strand:- start:102 stop:719 length:618 start_codon:yes stop_codon:yes gene_type:complete
VIPQSLAELTNAAEVVKAGGVVSYPTETFYALGADPAQPKAIERVLRTKGRKDLNKPLLLLIATLDDLPNWVSKFPSSFDKLVAHFWPGPLTLVLPAQAGLPDPLIGPGRGIAVRLTSHPIARALIRASGTALTGTSANRAGSRPCCDAKAVRATLGNDLGAVVDGGPTVGAKPSTVLDLVDDCPRILRHGAIEARALARVIRLV